MIGIIKRPNMPKAKPVNPDDYFDPTTHIATEENFIRFLETETYTADVIGYKVQLSSIYIYNNCLWVIADVNHDSENTDQSNCYDLISYGCFSERVFSDNYSSYRNSKLRTFLHQTLYSGLSSNLKVHMLNPKYNSQGIWYNDDNIIVPSYTEINGGTSSYADNEGTAYPIFTDRTSRIKHQNNSTTIRSWWTRSRYTSSSSYAWYVDTYGNTSDLYVNNNAYTVAILRVS